MSTSTPTVDNNIIYTSSSTAIPPNVAGYSYSYGAPNPSYGTGVHEEVDLSHIEARLEKLLELLEALEQSVTDKLQAIDERLSDLEWELEKQTH